jgi:hypothetical protein
MRETGPVRIVIPQSPDEAAEAQRYIGIARTQLGITKNMMRLGGLQSLTRRVVLADGALVLTGSVMGQDFVRIVPSSANSAANRKRTQPLRQRRQIPRYGEYAWTRLADGPAKHGHQAIWDIINNRLLVWGGYDRELPVLPAFERIDGTSHYDYTGQGIYVSDVITTPNSTAPAPGVFGPGSTFPAGVVFDGPYAYTLTSANVILALADKFGAEVFTSYAQWGSVSYTTPFGNTYFTEGYYASRAVGDGTYEWAFVYHHEAVLFADTPIRRSEDGGQARYAYTVNEADSGGPYPNTAGFWFSGNGGGDFYDATGDEIATFYENAGELAPFYLTSPPAADSDWADNADAYMKPGTTLGSYVSPYFSGTYGQLAWRVGRNANLFDLLMSTELWQYTRAGGWTQLDNISWNAWQAMVAAIVAADNTIPSQDGTGTTYGYGKSVALGAALGVSSPTNAIRFAASVGYEDGSGEVYHEYEFGGTIDGTDLSQSAQLWVYEAQIIGYEDDPTDTGE